ncbi:cysteine rich repeat-containing protein [Aquamicrobium terrae]
MPTLLFPVANVNLIRRLVCTVIYWGDQIMNVLKTLSVLLLSTGLFTIAGLGSNASAQGFTYCKADVQRLCKGMMPGGGKILKCLKSHENDLTVGCAKELKAMKAKMGK